MSDATDRMLDAAASDALERFRSAAFKGRAMTEVEVNTFRAGFMAGISWGTDYARKLVAPKLT